MYFAAKQAAMRKFREDKEKARKQGRSEGHSEGLVEGRSEGISEGRSIERTRIMNELSRRGALTPELLQILSGEDEDGS